MVAADAAITRALAAGERARRRVAEGDAAGGGANSGGGDAGDEDDPMQSTPPKQRKKRCARGILQVFSCAQMSRAAWHAETSSALCLYELELVSFRSSGRALEQCGRLGRPASVLQWRMHACD